MALNNVPLSGQSLAITRSPINLNFNVIAMAFVQDHVDYQAPGQGKHKQLTMPAQAGDSTTAAGEMALYTKLVNAIPQLFIRQQSNGSIVNATQSNFTPNTSGYTYLPSGVLIKYGTFLAAPGSNIFIFPTTGVPAIPTFGQNPFIALTPYSGGAATYDCYISVKNTTQFSYYNTAGGNISVDYIAIGIGL